jgi:hypothetical protein
MFDDARDTVGGDRADEPRLGKIVLALGQRFVETRGARHQLAVRPELVALVSH